MSNGILDISPSPSSSIGYKLLLILFYTFIVFLLIAVNIVEIRDHSCDKLLINDYTPEKGYCKAMESGLPKKEDSLEEHIEKVKNVNLRIPNTVLWRRILTGSIVITLILGWILTSQCYFNIGNFFIIFIIIFTVMMSLFNWLNYHYYRPHAMLNNKLYERIKEEIKIK